MDLAKLIENIAYRERLYCNEKIDVTGLCIDSRLCKKGDLFICLVGEKSNSHDYAAQAMQNGAIAFIVTEKLPFKVPQILVEDSRETMSILASVFYGEPSKRLKIIGVTGTNGKTTTTYMLKNILDVAGKMTGIVGTLGIFYANKKISPTLTTPDPIFLQSVLADMCECGVEYVVMEISAHALYYKKDSGLRFSACIFTNFTQDHLDFFDTMSAYKSAKSKLFSPKKCPIAVLNGDDPVGREFAKVRALTDANGTTKTVFYGMNTPTEAFAIITDENVYGVEFVINISDKLSRVSLSLTGKHNVYNALAAAVCATELGICLADVADGLQQLKKVDGRLEFVKKYNGADIFVDFAHTPDGLKKSIDSLKAHAKGKLICVFGCGGNRDKSKRIPMGETVARKADFSVLTSDNPRYEDPLDIISEIEKGYRRFSTKYVVVPDRRKGIGYALERLNEGDILLVAGKGGEEYQEIMGIKYGFNDKDVIEELIEQKNAFF